MTNADCFCNKNNIHIHSTVRQNAIVVFEKNMTKYTNKRTKYNYAEKKWKCDIANILQQVCLGLGL